MMNSESHIIRAVANDEGSFDAYFPGMAANGIRSRVLESESQAHGYL